MTWRDAARPIIAEVIKEVGTDDMRKLRAALREAYPWGLRKYHPYKIWCNEIRVQLGEVPPPQTGRWRVEGPSAGQKDLFGE
jgi:hypothetical protein